MASNGIIESIRCINFMCHANLTVKLGPLLNFVVGENGSGKSAVLTAITICLGGKASATNRAGSLKALIKEGRDYSRLIIEIKNQHDGAYKHDLFGDKIIIERHFTRAGSSSFKMKSAAGHTVSSKKADIDDMVEYFALQVDNPLTVLSQDNAREFLNSATPAGKYRLWVQGVNLEALDNDYRLIAELADVNMQRLADFKDTIAYLGKNKEQAKKLRDIIKKNKQAKNHLSLLRAKLTWVQVAEQERALEDAKTQLEANETKISRFEEAVQSAEASHTTIEERVSTARLEAENLMQEASEYRTRVEEAIEDENQERRALQDLHHEERNAKLALDRSKQKLDAKQAELIAENKRMQAISGGELAQNMEKVCQAKKELQSLFSRQSAARDSFEMLETKRKDVQLTLADLNKKKKAKDSQVAASVRRLDDLQTGQSDIYRVFHRNLPNFLRAIDRDKGFRDKPIGPIGLHIHLREHKWALLIDKYLGSNLDSFVVTNHPDRMRLHSLMQRFGISSMIHETNPEPLDCRGKEPDPEISTIMRVLKFDHEICRSVLIIRNDIDQAVLIPQRKDAEAFILRDDGKMPRNVKGCLTFHESKNEGLMIINNRDGASTTPINRLSLAPRLRLSNEAQTQVEEQTLAGLREEARCAAAYLEQAREEDAKWAAQLAECRQELRALDSAVRKKNVEIETLEETVANLQNQDSQVDALTEELEELRNHYELLGRQFGETSARKKAHANVVKETKHVVAQRREEQEKFESKINKADLRLRELVHSLRLAQDKRTEAHTRLDMQRMERTRLQTEVEELTEHVEGMTRDAEAVHERVYITPDETIEGIQRKYQDIKARLAQRGRQQGKSDEEILEDYRQASRDFESAQRDHAICRKDNDLLRHTLAQRLVLWRKFQRIISASTRVNFEFLLAVREFRGRVVLDHREHKLQVEVEPDQARKDVNGRNTKTLSGGEKSYSSVCLLLAIWEAMGSPLRCLDEFDVFMDNVNRSISTKLLVSSNLGFFFFFFFSVAFFLTLPYSFPDPTLFVFCSDIDFYRSKQHVNLSEDSTSSSHPTPYRSPALTLGTTSRLSGSQIPDRGSFPRCLMGVKVK